MTDSKEIPLGPDGKIEFKDADNKKRGCLKYVLIAVVALGLLIGGCAFVVFKGTEKAEKQARSFAEAMIANDVDGAYALTSSGFREATPKASLGEVASRLNAGLDGADLKVTGRGFAKSSGSATTSTISYTAQKGERKAFFRIELRDEGERGWKVVNFESSDTPFVERDS